jgi:hypothetical protein
LGYNQTGHRAVFSRKRVAGSCNHLQKTLKKEIHKSEINLQTCGLKYPVWKNRVRVYLDPVIILFRRADVTEIDTVSELSHSFIGTLGSDYGERISHLDVLVCQQIIPEITGSTPARIAAEDIKLVLAIVQVEVP